MRKISEISDQKMRKISAELLDLCCCSRRKLEHQVLVTRRTTWVVILSTMLLLHWSEIYSFSNNFFEEITGGFCFPSRKTIQEENFVVLQQVLQCQPQTLQVKYMQWCPLKTHQEMCPVQFPVLNVLIFLSFKAK